MCLTLVATNGFPDLARASAAQLKRPYTAHAPGPNCDSGGAIWFVSRGQPIPTQCEHNGLVAVVQPRGDGDVAFVPPNGFTSPNYRISVTVKLSPGFDGCVSIFTRSSAADRYNNCLCADSSASAGVLSTSRGGNRSSPREACRRQ